MYTIGYIGYYEFNIESIIKKYCINKAKSTFRCNGKCHLAKKLSLSKSQISYNTNALKSITNSISEAFVPVFFQEESFNINFFEIQNSKKIDSNISQGNYNISLSIASPPPRYFYTIYS